MALLAFPVFVPKSAKSATRSPGRARTVEQETSRAVEARTFWTELNVFRSFGRRRWRWGAPNVANVANVALFWGWDKCDICKARFGTVWHGLARFFSHATAPWRGLARFGAIGRGFFGCATRHDGHGRAGKERDEETRKYGGDVTPGFPRSGGRFRR